MGVPREVLAAFGLREFDAAPLIGGLINETFTVGPPLAPVAILQRLHPVFGAGVNLDLEKVTERLALRGVPETPRLIRTQDGQLSLGRWRALSFVPGRTVDQVESLQQARSAGATVGAFHRALHPWTEGFSSVVVLHDGPHHFAALAERGDVTSPFGAELLRCGRQLTDDGHLPRRVGHRDLKLSNVRFAAADPEQAVCLIDLDTVGWSTLADELGDAMRSWCNRAAEDEAPDLDVAVFAAALQGYVTTSPWTDPAELRSVVDGLERVCLVQAARFAVDIVDDSYFAWNPSLHTSRAAHNQARAEAALALHRACRAARAEFLDAVADVT